MVQSSSIQRVNSISRLGRLLGLVGVLITSLLLTGCLSTKHYVDPTLPKVAITDLKQPAVKQTVQLQFEFQTNGSNNLKATDYVRPIVVDTMKKSNLFSDVVVAPATADRKLYVTINNLSNMADAKARGFTTGLTFGLSGTMVTDGYMLTASDTAPGKEEVKHSYKHALYTTVGNADGPAGLHELPREEAVHAIMEGLTLNLLNDMSKSGELQ